MIPSHADLVVRNQDLATGLAVRAKRRWPHGDPADILSDAFVGLIDAAERWDPDGKAAFRTFARPRIWGEIIDGYRRRHGRRGQKTERLIVDDPDNPLDIAADEPGYEAVDEALSIDEVPWLPVVWLLWDRKFRCVQCHATLTGIKRVFCGRLCKRRFEGGSTKQGPARKWERRAA